MPPHNASYTLEGIAGNENDTQKYLSNIFTKCIESYFDKKSSNADKDKCEETLKKLGELEPYIIELQGLVGKIDKKAEERKKDIHEKIIPCLKGIDKDINDIKIVANKTHELLRNHSRGIGLFLIVVGIAIFFYWVNNSLFTLLQSPLSLSLIVSLMILLVCIVFIIFIKQQNPFMFLGSPVNSCVYPYIIDSL